MKSSPFEKHFAGKPNTTWKSLASDKIINISVKGKSILLNDRATNWGSDDKTEDVYVDEPLAKINRNPTQKRNDSQNQTQTTSDNRMPINNPFSKE